MANPFMLHGSPNGTRTRVTGVRGRRPRPLDDGTKMAGGQGFEPWFAGPEPAVLPLNDPPVSLVIILSILSFDVKQKMLPSFFHTYDNIREDASVKITRRRSWVQRFKGSRFHSRPRTPLRIRICEKSVIFVRPNPKSGAKLAITWENEHF